MSKREEYVDKLKQQLDEWNQEIDKLESRLAEASAPARSRLEPQIAKLREGYAGARRKLAALRNAGEESWDELSADTEHAWKALKQSINYFKSQVKRPDS